MGIKSKNGVLYVVENMPPKLPNPKEFEKIGLAKPKKKPTFDINKKPI